MATDVQICSHALMLLGDAPIASLSDNTPRATLCANIYANIKASILREHPWNCAIVRVVLAPMTSAPVNEWGYQFTLPGDCLRVLDCGEIGQSDYQLEGNKILCDTNVLHLRYVASVHESLFDSNLTNVLIKRMELELCYPITKSTSHRETLKQEYYARGVGILARAKAVDGQENPPADYGDSPFINARYGAVQ